MRGLVVGDLGRLKNCLQVQGLNQGLISVSHNSQTTKTAASSSTKKALSWYRIDI